MSFASCICPLPTAITPITIPTCGENFGQIQKIIFQRRQAGSTPWFDTIAHSKLIANWTTLKSASDNTKVVGTPLFEGFTIPMITAIVEAGDTNATLDGAPIVVGAKTPVCAGDFRSLPAATLVSLKTYNCENNLWAIFVNEFGNMIASSSDGTMVQGIPIYNYFIGDTGGDGKNKHNKTHFEFNLKFGWADKLVYIAPTDFQALTTDI